ncbi:MAG: hypothetical protein J6V62_05865, partial [Paludibacteraceae bacterium]|nr:hypothetical protein [Paludibacteraceae bacterium]
MMFVDKDTICAVSTPAGVGGVAIVRISGDKAIAIADSVLQLSKPLADKKANTVSFGRLLRKSQVDSPNHQITESPTEILDEVLVSLFRAPHSFTGEDVVEIAVHGSVYVQREAIKLLLSAGCRMADHGEFTKRAFMN